jgi:hypothetical protein
MPVLTIAALPSHNSADQRAPASRPLGLVEQELALLCGRMADLPKATDPAGASVRRTLQHLQVHLFLTASQLLPVWRDMCVDAAAVDRADVRLGLLRQLTDQTLAAGEGDGLTDARCEVLAQELARHLQHTMALLRAMHAVVDRDSLWALAEVWASEGQRLRRAQRLGLALEMDNEDADPVGQVPH